LRERERQKKEVENDDIELYTEREFQAKVEEKKDHIRFQTSNSPRDSLESKHAH
jgi:hypothetical protein